MQFMWFTERAYHDIPEEEVIRSRSFFGLPNTHFDPQKGSELLNQYLDENGDRQTLRVEAATSKIYIELAKEE